MADLTILVSDQYKDGRWTVEVSASGDTMILGEPSASQCLAESMMRYAEEQLGTESKDD